MKKRHMPEQIVGKLRQADVELGKGQTRRSASRSASASRPITGGVRSTAACRPTWPNS